MSEYYDSEGYLTDAGFEADADTLGAAWAARTQPMSDQPARTEPGDHYDDYHHYTVPDGMDLTPSEIRHHARALGLTTKQAQAMLDHAPALLQRQQSNDWAAQSQSQFTETDLAAAKSMLAKVGSPGLIDQLNKTGLGNHPAFIKMFADAERKLANKGSRNDVAARMYPNMER